MTTNDCTARAAPALERYHSVAQLSERTGIPKRTIYDAIERGELAVFVPNGCVRGYRIAESEAMRWIDSCVCTM